MSEKPVRDAPDGEGEIERDDAIIGRAFGWSVLAILFMAGIAAGVYAIFQLKPREVVRPTIKPKAAEKRTAPEQELPRVKFADITLSAGVRFELENGAYGGKLLPETMCGGCAFLDFDNDTHQDLLLINASRWPWDTRLAGPPATPGLFRNDGHGNFSDVTAGSGLEFTTYGMGVAVGDFDGDGWTDIFVSALGRDRLLKNQQGKFVDVTETARVGGAADAWGTSCGFFDYDNDRDLDLFVCNYIQWTKEIDEGLGCTLVGQTRAYCRVDQFQGAFPYLYRNDGGGLFTDVSAESGVQVANAATGVPVAKSLGLSPVDVDADGWMDLVVANDTVQNFLFHNQQDGTFAEIGAISGIAFDAAGNARGAMGTDSAWFRNDDTLGVAIGNFSNEMSALYVSQGFGLAFDDRAIATGLGPPSRLMLKFGMVFLDYDLDGRQDLLTANGHLEDEIRIVQESQRYEQPPHLFNNCGSQAPSEFELVPTELCGPDFSKPMVGRGAAYADIDGDGDLDVAITATKGSPRLLRNDQALGRHWLRVKLQGTRCNREAIGAWVEVQVGEVVQRRQVMPTRSYLSQVELPVSFGLGSAERVDRIAVRWPGGELQELLGVSADQTLLIEQPASPPTATASKKP